MSVRDPRMKNRVKDALFAFLYTPSLEQLEKQLLHLIIRNSNITRWPFQAFVYKGEFYNREQGRPPLRKCRLVPELHAEMDEYLAAYDEIHKREVPFVVGGMVAILNATPCIHDLFKIFPESLHAPIRQIARDYVANPDYHLTPEQITELQTKYKLTIQLMKRRMVINLII